MGVGRGRFTNFAMGVKGMNMRFDSLLLTAVTAMRAARARSPEPGRGRDDRRHRSSAVLGGVTSALLAIIAALALAPAAVAAGPSYFYGSRKVAAGSTEVLVFSGLFQQRAITVGSNPKLLAATPDGSRIYVANAGSNNVSVIATVSSTVTATIPVGTSPYGVAVSPDGALVLVSNNGGASVSLIDTATNTVVSTIAVGNNPRGVAFSVSGGRAYVACDTAVHVIDVATRTVIATIGGFQLPQRIAMAPGGATAYVSDLNLNSVSFVNLATNTVTVTGSVAVASVRGLVVLPDGRLYATNATSSSTTLTAIDVATMTGTPISMGRAQEGEIAYDGQAFVYSNDYLVGLTQLRVADNAHTANLPIGVAVSGMLYGEFGNEVRGATAGGGTITSSVFVVGGNSATLTVTPNAGNQIASVSTDNCNGSRSGNSYTTGAVTTRVCNVTATFTPIPAFSCTANSSPGDSTAVSCTGLSAGGTLSMPGGSCSAIAAGSATCSGATSATGTAPPMTLALNGGTLTLAATPTFTVVGSVGTGLGSITSSQVVAANVAAAFTVTPQTGYHVTTITTTGCDGSFSAPTYTTAPITAACTVTANFAIDTFTIASSANPPAGGSVSCTPNPVNYGQNSVCTATANTGYSFNTFSGDCTGATCTLSNVTAARNVTANFTLNSYAISTTASPLAGGSVTCTPNPVSHGSGSTCTATANAGYTFAVFSGDCAGASCVLSNVTGTRSVTASFTLNSYAITATASPLAGGTVTCTPNPVAHGSNSTCTATANTGYTFASFSGDCTGANCLLSNVTGTRNVTANFTLNTYTVTTTASPLAGGSVTCTPNPVAHGGNSTCTATANTGYTFSAFSGDCTGASCVLSNVTGARSVTATFTLNTYAITTTASPLAGGSVTCTPNPVAHGSNSTCTATANTGYTFTSFSGDCAGATCVLGNVTGTRNVTANFTLNTYAITTTASPLAGGSVTCTPNPVAHGSNSTCTATASTGYTFAAFSGDCAGASCVLSNVTGARSVTATFTLNTYAITTTASPLAGGSVMCTPNPVAHGSNSTCAATANTGHTFASFSGDCSGATCVLSNVTGTRNVTANFTLNTYAITTTASPLAGGSVTCTPNPVAHGSSSTCTATANTGYTFAAFSGDCTGASCVLGNVTGTRNVTASFTLNSYTITATANPAAGGTVSCSPNPVSHGSNSSCTATANTGFTFAAFSGDCSGAACTLTAVTADRSVTANFIAVTTFSGPTATHTGTATATLSGGGPACHFDPAATALVLPSVPASVSRIEFPHGWFTFKATGCTVGSTVRVSITWPSMGALNYLKYYASAPAAARFAQPANLSVSGNTVSFDVADGGAGDDDHAANGEIVDPSGPAQYLAAEPIPVAGSALPLALLLMLLAVVALRRRA